MDLSGGNASEDSFTMWAANLVAAYVMDLQPDLFLSIAPGPTAGPEGSDCPVCPGPVTD